MNENIFVWLTPITYWSLVILWGMVLLLYLRAIRDWRHRSTAMRFLLWVLFIDAIRTIFESLYFGGWYTARVGLFPEYIYEFLVQPQYVFIPKMVNVIAAVIIVFLLLRKWLPQLGEELETQKSEIETFTRSQKMAHCGNWEWNIVTDVLLWSDEIYRIFGLQPQQFGATYEAFLQSVHPHDRARVAEAVEKAMNDPHEHYSVEYRVLRPDGSVRTVHEMGKVVWNEERKATYMSGTVQDITERKEAENELKEAKEAAETANRIKSSFLANMSHELRTPLNAIIGFAEMLGYDRYTSKEQKEKIAIINRSSDHLLNMINDVLDLSRIEAGHVEVEPESFNLPLMLKDIGQMFEVRAEKAGLAFELSLHQALSRYVKTDVGKLRQIIINLLGNALKYSREGGFSLHARTMPVEGEPGMTILQLKVEDSGPGISPEYVDRIFEPFFQAKEDQNGSKSSGLGLVITKSFVELMGGEISVESRPGKGTLFSVELPVAQAEAVEAMSVKAAPREVLGLEPGQPSWRILVVEDNMENRLLLSSLLKEAGFEIREAVNGKEAVDLFQQWEPHFIWMDMRLPVMDGYEATAKIRSLPKGNKVKIVAITASALREQHKRILDSGCNAVVTKPFKRREIFHALERYLDVSYTYEEEKEVKADEEEITLTSDMLTDLPPDLRELLREAALKLDIPATDGAIKEIGNKHPEIARGLQLLAREFRFEKILELLGGKH
ncbi:MAG: ATP-binding protein [Deltaproteobacteria bacterium]|nr:ATP-binding protein [Deltaproteobacteria bacterium]